MMIRQYFTTILSRLMRNSTLAFVTNATGLTTGLVYCLLLILSIQDKMSYHPYSGHGDLYYLHAYAQYKSIATENKPVTPAAVLSGREQIHESVIIHGTANPSALPQPCLPGKKPSVQRIMEDSIFSFDLPMYKRTTENPKKALV